MILYVEVVILYVNGVSYCRSNDPVCNDRTVEAVYVNGVSYCRSNDPVCEWCVIL